jgi:uncharacterized protein (DUF2147 family)
MKKFYILAALLMATTAAHAGNGISFEVEGHKVHIEVPRNCDSLSCLQISAPGLSGSNFGFKSKRFNNEDDVVDAPAPAPAVQATAPAPVAPAYVPPANVAPAPVAVAPVAAPTTAVAPTYQAAVTDNIAPAPAPVATGRVASVAPTAPVAPAPVAVANTPLGVWATEENKGNVRVEQCGPNLCGYAVKTGEKILINMKPSDAKWSGQIHDPDSGKNYDSTIAMKGPNAMRVQGCAFGGMFCGGQTWKRVG